MSTTVAAFAPLSGVLAEAIAKRTAEAGRAPLPIPASVAPEAEEIPAEETPAPVAIPAPALDLQAMIAQAVASAVAGLAVPAPVATPAQTAKGKGKIAKPAPAPVKVAPAVKASDYKGPWHLGPKALGRMKDGKPFYAVVGPSVLADANVCIALTEQYGDVVILVNGRFKPIYLRARALAAMIDAAPLLARFFKGHAERLTALAADAGRDSEE